VSITQAEQEFENYLAALNRDARGCAVLAYTEFAIHFTAGHDFPVIDRLNRHPAFWNAILGALQASAIVSLGRIFDRRSDTYSAAQLLGFAEKSLGIFRRGALAARKERAGLAQHDAQAYAADAYELRPGGLDDIRRQFEQKRQFFENKVAPIRHQVYAHAGKLNGKELDQLFNGLPMRALEDLIVFPLRLERAMFNLYHNGRAPALEAVPSLIHDVLKAEPNSWVRTWEHSHAAANAAAFLDWLRGTPLED
jgi:HEPN superfamily AbiU2-like protein